MKHLDNHDWLEDDHYNIAFHSVTTQDFQGMKRLSTLADVSTPDRY